MHHPLLLAQPLPFLERRLLFLNRIPSNLLLPIPAALLTLETALPRLVPIHLLFQPLLSPLLPQFDAFDYGLVLDLHLELANVPERGLEGLGLVAVEGEVFLLAAFGGRLRDWLVEGLALLE